MAEKYPHDELVRAWLDGRKVQYLDTSGHVLGGIWVDIEGPDVAEKMPHFYRHGTRYRIKPVTLRYRVAMMKGGNGGLFNRSASCLADEREIERDEKFVRWITYWIEVVV